MDLTQEQKQLLLDEYDKHKKMAVISNSFIGKDMIMEAYKANDLLQPDIYDGTYYYLEISDTLKILVQVEDSSEWKKEDLKWYRLYRIQHMKPRTKKVTNQQLFEAMKIIIKLLAHFNVDNKLVHNCNNTSALYNSEELVEEECILFPYALDKMFLIKKVSANANEDNSWCLLDLG